MVCHRNNANDATGTCKEAPTRPVGWNPFCIACSPKSFSLSFGRPFPALAIDPTGKLGTLLPNTAGKIPGFPPPMPGFERLCENINGFKFADGETAKLVQIRGFGFGWGQDLGYGMNKGTRGTQCGGRVPNVWDGYLDVPLPPNPGTEAWFAFRFNLIPSPLHARMVSGCKIYAGAIVTDEIRVASTLEFKMDLELYIETGAQNGGDTCVIIAINGMSAKIGNSELVFGRGIGGWCKTKGLCNPSGFFLNVEPTFDFRLMGISVLSGIFGGVDYADEQTPTSLTLPDGTFQLSGGASLGVFMDPTRKNSVTSVVFRFQLPTLKVFGIPVTADAGIHFQWFKGSELNRRIHGVLRINGTPNCPVITSNCRKWKPYERRVGGKDVYNGTAEICESRLLDMDHYNVIMTVAEKPGKATLPTRIDRWHVDHIQKYYNNEKFDQYAYPGSSNLVFYLKVSSPPNPIVFLKELSMTVVMQIEGAVDVAGPVSENMTTAEITNLENQLKATLNSTKNSEIDVYVELYTEISVAFVVDVAAAASMQNNPGGQGYDKWVASFVFPFRFGPLSRLIIAAQTKPFKKISEASWDVSITWQSLDLGKAIREGVKKAYNAVVVKPLSFVVNKVKAIGQELVEDLKDSILGSSFFDKIKRISDTLATSRAKSMEEIEAALEAEDYFNAFSEITAWATNEALAMIQLMTAIAVAQVNALLAALSFFQKFYVLISKGLVQFYCWVDVCYYNEPETKTMTLTGQTPTHDEDNCKLDYYESTSCCACRPNFFCDNIAKCPSRDKPCTVDAAKKKWSIADPECKRKANAAKAKAAYEKKKAEAEAKKAKYDALKRKIINLDNFMYIYRFNRDEQTKGLKHAALNDNVLGSPTATIPETTIATAGVKDSHSRLRATVTGLPRLKSASTEVSFSDDDVIGNEVIEIDFFLKPGETNTTAQERIEKEVTEVISARAMRKVLGGIKARSTRLSDFLHSPAYYDGTHSTRQEAYNACKAEGLQLCRKKELTGFHRCSPGWLADDQGFWLDFNVAGCGTKGFNSNTGSTAGAYCCPEVPELRKEGELTTYTEARDECLRVGKRLCHDDELIGFGSNSAGFTFMMKKTWWTPVAGTCGSEGVNHDDSIADVGAYCCEMNKPTYLPVPQGGEAYAYETRKQASDACAKHGLQLCGRRMVEGFELCAIGWMADAKGYWMDDARQGCGYGQGFRDLAQNGWGGAYCCAVQPEFIKTSALTSQIEALKECAKIDKKLCSREQLLGFETCSAGYVNDGSKSWYRASTAAGCGVEGLNSDASIPKVGAYCCEDDNDRPHFLPEYETTAKDVYATREEASVVCASRGLQLCKRADILHYERCDSGWLADATGYFTNQNTTDCAGPGFVNTNQAKHGAYCCETVPAYVEPNNFNDIQDARLACKSIQKDLCFSQQLVGYDLCKPGFTSEGLKSWWSSNDAGAGCGQAGLSAQASATQVGAYCCENDGPYYLPFAEDPLIYPNRHAAASACKVKGLQLCAKNDITDFENCAVGWLADGRGLWMKTARHKCGAAGYNDMTDDKLTDLRAGAYCCDLKAELIKPAALTSFEQATADCAKLNKIVGAKNDLIGNDNCMAGYVSDGSKSWWMAHSSLEKASCGKEGMNTNNEMRRVGVYCCQKPVPAA